MRHTKDLFIMGNGRQSRTKESAPEQRVPTNWRQHSPKVSSVKTSITLQNHNVEIMIMIICDKK